MKKKLLAGVAACLFMVPMLGTTTTAKAATTVIDFEDIAIAAGSGTSGPKVSRGYNFSSPVFNGTENNADGAFNDTTHYFAHSQATMSRIDGNPFELLSFDLGEDFSYGVAFDRYPRFLTVIGNLSGGGFVSQVVILDGLFDGPGGIADFQKVTLTGFSNLQSVYFYGNGGSYVSTTSNSNAFALDNLVVVNPVPVPAALLLFGSGLAGLIGSRVRRKNSHLSEELSQGRVF